MSLYPIINKRNVRFVFSLFLLATHPEDSCAVWGHQKQNKLPEADVIHNWKEGEGGQATKKQKNSKFLVQDIHLHQVAQPNAHNLPP